VIVLSLGAGVQSTALFLLSETAQRGCPRADFAVFADTGDEPPWVYEQVARLQARNTIPVHIATAGCLSAEILKRKRGERRSVASIPAFTDDHGQPGMMPRQCTRDFKLRPISRKIRELGGGADGQQVIQLIGISADETHRMRDSRVKWLRTSYPLVDAGITRDRCRDIVQAAGLPEPQKSACVYCPYHSDATWLALKTDHPEQFARAVAFDEAIRDLRTSRVTHPVYLHRSLTPLRDVAFDTGQLRLEGFGNECEGMCGV
jgi:hypothetical protein